MEAPRIVDSGGAELIQNLCNHCGHNSPSSHMTCHIQNLPCHVTNMFPLNHTQNVTNLCDQNVPHGYILIGSKMHTPMCSQCAQWTYSGYDQDLAYFYDQGRMVEVFDSLGNVHLELLAENMGVGSCHPRAATMVQTMGSPSPLITMDQTSSSR